MRKITQKYKINNAVILLIMALLTPLNFAFPFGFIFSGEANGVTIVTHPIGYTGAGGTISLTVGINPASPNAANMVVSTQNVIAVFNENLSTTGNIIFGPLPSGNIDFESVLLHEMGHSLGLRHCNLASESGLSGTAQNYTQSTDGADNVYGLNPGPDSVIGTADDLRGDDVNLNYFKIADNNPFTIASTVDQTTYSRDIADLPSGTYSANGDINVGVTLGVPNSEAVMQQGSRANERQRTLSADDVAGLRYAMAGLDEIAGTADDYTLELNYVGLTNFADIVIAFDNTETGFAVSQSGGTFLNSDHLAITTNNIFFNTGFSWYFNTVALPAPPAVVCTPFTTDLGVGGTVTIQASDVDGGTTDPNGDTFTLSVSPSTFTCAEVGENTVTLTATDSNGMSSSCETTVTINPGGSPLEAICLSPTIALDASGTVTITATDIDGGSTAGNCGFDEIFLTSGSASVTTNITSTVDFNGGANRGCMFDIVATNTIEINSFDIRPTQTTGNSADYEVYYKVGSFAGSQTNTGDWTLLASPTISPITEGVITPLNLSLGLNVSNGQRVSFYITPTDGSRLLIETGNGTGSLWTSDANLELYEGGLHNYPFGGAIGDFVLNGNIRYSIPSVFDGNFDCTDIGPNTITLNVKDPAGNIDSCEATVTIADTTPPALTCPSDETIMLATGVTTYALPDYFALGSVTGTDNCATGLSNTTQTPAPGTLLTDGVYTITFTATDDNSNLGQCTFELTVDDPALSIDDVKFDMSSVTLYPNPAQTVINVKNPNGLNLSKFNIYDLSGRLVLSEKLDGIQSEKAIDVSILQSSIYLCIIESDRGQLVKRIIKE